jgi:hypothetical protein
VNTTPLEKPGFQPGILNACDPEIEASLRPLEEFMIKLLRLLEERGAEWAEQTPLARVESMLQALRQL